MAVRISSKEESALSSSSSRRKDMLSILAVVLCAIISIFMSSPNLRACQSQQKLSSVTNFFGTQTTSSSSKQQHKFLMAQEGETAIIITSSWIKSYPTLYFIDNVIESIFQYLEGLHSNVPIYIAVDGLRIDNKELNQTETDIRLKQLDEYIEMLYIKYNNRTNIHIIVSTTHKHISGNVQKVMNIIETHHPQIQYVYYIQHDFAFQKPINHIGLVKSMSENPNTIKIVRFMFHFNPRDIFLRCIPKNVSSDQPFEDPEYTQNDVYLWPTKAYSDNNHLANFKFYKYLIDVLGPQPRAPEGPLQYKSKKQASKNCSQIGLWTYEDPITGKPYWSLKHLDGRKKSRSKIID